MTVGQALSWAIQEFTNLTDAGPSARFLLADLLGYTVTEIDLKLDQSLSKGQIKEYRKLVSRRSHHEPVSYILGHHPFAGVELSTDARALIPRPETEQLVEIVVAYLQKQPIKTIVDVGTGSGAIALALAAKLKDRHHDLHIYATDISAPALALAEYNSQKLNFPELLSFVEADLLLPKNPAIKLPRTELIVANLPYVPTGRITRLDPTVRDYEPSLALDGGTDGLKYYRTLAEQIIKLGWRPKAIFCEIDESHAEAWRELAKSYWPDSEVRVEVDLRGQPRFGIIG